MLECTTYETGMQNAQTTKPMFKDTKSRKMYKIRNLCLKIQRHVKCTKYETYV